jgi:hypothetical protein
MTTIFLLSGIVASIHRLARRSRNAADGAESAGVV